MVQLNAELQAAPVNRIGEEAFNWSDLVKHTIRNHFGRKGATYSQLKTYFKENNINIHPYTLSNILLRLSGQASDTPHRDDLKVKYLKRDGVYVGGRKSGEPIPRFYFNDKGTQRSAGGVRKVYHTNKTRITVTKLSTITGNNVAWYGF